MMRKFERHWSKKTKNTSNSGPAGCSRKVGEKKSNFAISDVIGFRRCVNIHQGVPGVGFRTHVSWALQEIWQLQMCSLIPRSLKHPHPWKKGMIPTGPMPREWGFAKQALTFVTLSLVQHSLIHSKVNKNSVLSAEVLRLPSGPGSLFGCSQLLTLCLLQVVGA